MRTNLLLCALFITALTASGQPEADQKLFLHPSVRAALDKFEKVYGPWSIERADGTIASLAGASEKLTREQDFGALVLLKTAAEVSRARRETFGQPVIREYESAKQYIYQQTYKRDSSSLPEPIENAFVAITVGRNAVYDVTIHTIPAGVVAPTVLRTPASAENVAKAAFSQDLQNERDESGQTLLEVFPALSTRATVLESKPLLALDGKMFRVYRVLVEASPSSDDRDTIVAAISYAIDASSEVEDPPAAAVVQRTWLTHRAAGFARVFDPNPINTLNACDLNPRDIPLKAFFDKELVDLAAPGKGRFRLSGCLVNVCDIGGPATQPPEIETTSEPKFFYCQNTPEFAAAMAFYHLESLQHYLADELGFKALARPIDVDVDGADPRDMVHANYYDWPPGDGRLSFGRQPTRFEAEDADLIAHEFGHAILSRDSEGRFGSTPEARAIGEGFSDYWAVSTFFELTKANGHRLDCVAEWIRGGRCLRTTTAKVSVEEFNGGKPSHFNGQIWSAILFDVFRVLGDRKTADTIIVQGHMTRQFAGPAPTMRDMAEGIVRADQQSFNSADVKRLCAVFTAHGIEDLDCCSAKGCLPKIPPITLPFVPAFTATMRTDHCRKPTP